jgi:serine/threonine-protein kinase
MTPPSERFRKLSELFDLVVELPAGEREEAILRECGSDAELEAELRALLLADAHSGVDDFFAGAVASEAGALQRSEFEGVRLGSWRIVEPIGEGGMGTVYLAERADGVYEARAAVKLVRGGIPSPMLAQRFRSERQILAGLSHPGVAQLLDGGSTEDGTPYLVMEFIDGEPITKYCDAHAVDLQGRLELFLRVCDAVAYAHRELVAHRDLKPSNILVTASGEPKLLDFGIAKLIDTVGEASEGVTQSYGIMTPAYASPEQVTGERAGASADLYSLGVLLYELLTGKLPIETRGLNPAELVSKVTGEVPAVASSVVADQERRRRLTGDLDAIVSQALRKEPEARYASVEALAEDIRLHLAGLPIRARRDDWRYRTGKAVRRNAGVVTAGMLLLIVGVTFTINAILQARAVGRERDRAEAQRATAERVSGFLEELFTEADPNVTSARDITVRDILDRGADRVLTGLADEPESRATLAVVIGRTYLALGEYDAAEPLLDSALAARLREGEANPMALGEAYMERGALAYNVGEYDAAVELQAQAVEWYEHGAGGDSHEVADAMGWLATAHVDAGNLTEAEAVMRAAVAMHRRVTPGPSQELSTALVTLEDILREAGKVEEAVAVGEEGLAMSREVYGEDHLETAFALNQLSSSLNSAGRTAEAIPLVEEGLAIRRAAFDGPHVEIAASLGNLSNMLSGVGRTVESIAPRRAATEMLRELFPTDHPYVAGSTTSLGTALLRADSLESAEPELRDGLAWSREAFGPRHPNVANPLSSLGTLYRRTGRYAESLAVLREAYSIRIESLPPGHWNIAAVALELGLTLDALDEDAEAEERLTEAHDILLESFGPADARTERARAALEAHLERREPTE